MSGCVECGEPRDLEGSTATLCALCADDAWMPVLMFDPMEHWACGRTKTQARRNHRLINRAARIASRLRLPAPYNGRQSADDWRRTLRHMTGCCYPDQGRAVALARDIVRGVVRGDA